MREPARAALLALTLAPLAAAQTGGPGTPGSHGVPGLATTPPELGGVLTATVTGAVPGAPVGLAHANQAGVLPTPFGTAWLDAGSVSVVGSAVADGAGVASFVFPIPATASAAEAPVHLQAFALDAGAAGGASLTNSLDLRVLGSRVYYEAFSTTPPWSAGVVAKSAVSGDDVFATDFTTTSPAVAFDGARARGALATATDVRIFDNHFGATLAVVPGAPGHPRLLADASGALLYVHRTTSVDVVHFGTGQTIGSFPMATPGGEWAGDPTGTHAYVATDVGGAPAIRHLDLGAWADLGTTPVGGPGDEVLHMTPNGTRLSVLVRSSIHQNWLYALDYASDPPSVLLAPIWNAGDHGLAVPGDGAGMLAFTQDACAPPGFPSSPFQAATSSFQDPFSVGQLQPVLISEPSHPAAGCARPYAWAPASTGAWLIDNCCQEFPDGDEAGYLWRYSWPGGWTHTVLTDHWGPLGVAVVEDAFGERVYTSHGTPFAQGQPGGLSEVDAATSQKTFRPVQVLPDADIQSGFLHAESIP